MHGDEQAIRELYERWYRAMSSGDASGVVDLLTEDVILKMPGSSALRGRSSVAQALEGFHSACSEDVEYVLEEVEVSGDLAYVRISENAVIRARQTDLRQVMSGVHLAILRRQGDGRWLVSRDVASLNEPEV